MSWEQQLFDELNRVRSNPAAYAAELQALRPNFDGRFSMKCNAIVQSDSV
jgi:hypothetical protein